LPRSAESGCAVSQQLLLPLGAGVLGLQAADFGPTFLIGGEVAIALEAGPAFRNPAVTRVRLARQPDQKRIAGCGGCILRLQSFFIEIERIRRAGANEPAFQEHHALGISDDKGWPSIRCEKRTVSLIPFGEA